MKPRIKLAATKAPAGGEVALYQHDSDYDIMMNGRELMNSRQHESELELARLGCAHLVDRREPCVLIGGLGMGYTLRQVLDMLNSAATVVVSELIPAVVEWNREYLGELNGHPLKDRRVQLRVCDVAGVIAETPNRFDAILLDVDNGPGSMSEPANRRLYGYNGIRACRDALRERGCLAVWSADPSKEYEHRMMDCGLHVRRFSAAVYKGSRSRSRYVWVASANRGVLPAGGGEPEPIPPPKPDRPSRPGRGFGGRGRDRFRGPRRSTPG